MYGMSYDYPDGTELGAHTESAVVGTTRRTVVSDVASSGWYKTANIADTTFTATRTAGVFTYIALAVDATYFFSKLDVSETDGFDLWMQGSGRARARAYNSAGALINVIADVGDAVDGDDTGNWLSFAVTHGASNLYKLFIDGVKVKQGTAVGYDDPALVPFSLFAIDNAPNSTATVESEGFVVAENEEASEANMATWHASCAAVGKTVDLAGVTTDYRWAATESALPLGVGPDTWTDVVGSVVMDKVAGITVTERI